MSERPSVSPAVFPQAGETPALSLPAWMRQSKHREPVPVRWQSRSDSFFNRPQYVTEDNRYGPVASDDSLSDLESAEIESARAAELGATADAVTQERQEANRAAEELEAKTEELEQARQALGAAIEEIKQAQAKWAADEQKRLGELSVEVARAILRQAVHSEPELLKRLAEQALQPFAELDSVHLRLGPKMHAALLVACDGPSMEHDGATIQLERDDTLDDQAIIAEGPWMRVDASVETRLQGVLEALREGWI